MYSQLEGLEEMRAVRDALVKERARAAAAEQEAAQWRRAHAALEAEYGAFAADREAEAAAVEGARATDAAAVAQRCGGLEARVAAAEREVEGLRAALRASEAVAEGLRGERDAAEAALRAAEVAHAGEATGVRSSGGGLVGWISCNL